MGYPQDDFSIPGGPGGFRHSTMLGGPVWGTATENVSPSLSMGQGVMALDTGNVPDEFRAHPDWKDPVPSITDAPTLGDGLRRTREESGRSLAELAADTRVHERYLRALVFYFLMQTLVNFCAAIAFVENRCHYHNVDLRRPHLPGVAGSPWAGRPEMEPNPAGSYVARALCTLSSFVGGITTNVVLELVLVRKARMVEGVDRLRRFLKAIAWLVVAQLLLLLVSTVGGFFSLTLPMLMEEPREDGRVFFSVFDTNGDGELTRQHEDRSRSDLLATRSRQLRCAFNSTD